MAPPAFVLVPGFWEGPGIFRRLVPELEQRGYLVATVTLASTGTPASSKDDPSAPPTPTLHDDAAAVRAVVTGLVDGDGDGQGRDVVVFAHSAGGVIAAEALRDLSPAARAGKKGGAVVLLALIAAAVWDEGVDIGPPIAAMSSFDWQGDRMVCISPRERLFNDIEDDAAAEAEVARLSFQPGFGWTDVVRYAAWKTDLPTAYLVCEQDAGMPPAAQRAFAELAKSDPVEAIDAGHSGALTQPRAVADFLVRVAEKACLSNQPKKHTRV